MLEHCNVHVEFDWLMNCFCYGLISLLWFFLFLWNWFLNSRKKSWKRDFLISKWNWGTSKSFKVSFCGVFEDFWWMEIEWGEARRSQECGRRQEQLIYLFSFESQWLLHLNFDVKTPSESEILHKPLPRQEKLPNLKQRKTLHLLEWKFFHIKNWILNHKKRLCSIESKHPKKSFLLRIGWTEIVFSDHFFVSKSK